MMDIRMYKGWMEEGTCRGPLSCVPTTTMSYLVRPLGQPVRPNSSSGTSLGALKFMLKVTTRTLRGLDCWGAVKEVVVQ